MRFVWVKRARSIPSAIGLNSDLPQMHSPASTNKKLMDVVQSLLISWSNLLLKATKQAHSPHRRHFQQQLNWRILRERAALAGGMKLFAAVDQRRRNKWKPPRASCKRHTNGSGMEQKWKSSVFNSNTTQNADMMTLIVFNELLCSCSHAFCWLLFMSGVEKYLNSFSLSPSWH